MNKEDTDAQREQKLLSRKKIDCEGRETMIDFLFVTSLSFARNPHPPYYFMYLAAYLREKGLKVKIVDVKGEDRPSDIKKHLDVIRFALKMNPSRFVGLAAFHSDYDMAMKLGRLVKEMQPQTILLVGNAHGTLDPEDFVYSGSPFDIAVLGEGEETCWELWNSFETKLPFEDYQIEGIAYLDSFSEELVKTPPRPFIDLKNLPMPAYDLIDMDWYLRPQKLVIRRIYASMMPIFAGRGCAWDCDFCAANSVWKANTGKAARLKPVKDVLKEIRLLRDRYEIDFFYLFDDTFGMSKKWMEEWFNTKFHVDGPSRSSVLPYACQTRANLIDEEMIKGLKETGCIQVDIGVESLSQRLLDKMNKQITLRQIEEAVRLCRKHRLRYFFTMLLNLPSETREDLKTTYEGLKRLKPDGVIFGVTTPYPGTKIYTEHCHPALSKEEYGLLGNNRLDPTERFRMTEHSIDLEVLWSRWNRRFKATPMFEKMWPKQGLYWKAVWNSPRFWSYVWCWIKDLPKTFILYWLHVLGVYRLAKRLQYKEEKP